MKFTKHFRQRWVERVGLPFTELPKLMEKAHLVGERRNCRRYHVDKWVIIVSAIDDAFLTIFTNPKKEATLWSNKQTPPTS